MKIRSPSLPAFVRGAFLAVLLAVGSAADAAPTAPGPEVPVWSLTDLSGKSLGSAELKGKVVVVDFWATWCAPCLGEIPGYIELQQKYGPQGLVVVGVSVDQKSPEAVAKFAQSKGINYRIAMADEEIADKFGGIEAIPTTILIDRTGHVVHRKVGALSHEEYEKLVVQALK